jgi:hypothetical protein
LKQTAVLLSLFALTAPAAEPEAWVTVATDPYVVKVRKPPGSPVEEVSAEGNLNAQVRDLQAALLDPERFRLFMPYVKEAREVSKREPDGSFYVYTRVQPPWVNSRDYIVRTYVDEGVGPDGQGRFLSHWTAVPDLLPQRAHAVRVRLDDGSWEITPNPDGKTSHVIYRFRVDPGGAIPAFAAEAGNRQSVPDTLRAIEREAQRLAAVRDGARTTPAR